MPDTIDLLQIKIEKAKAELSEETLRAIDAVPWQAEILKMRETKGYSFEQLGDMEIETELLLCGLLAPQDYPKELENRMKISKIQANELVEEMNKMVFSKIREELIRNTEQQKVWVKKPMPEEIKMPLPENPPKIVPKPIITPPPDTEEDKKINKKVFSTAGIEIMNGNGNGNGNGKLPVLEKLELQSSAKVHPILAQKLSGSFQIPTVKTEHSFENITKTSPPASPPPAPEAPKAPVSYPPKGDPYRLPPE